MMSKTIPTLLALVMISGPAHSATEKPTVVTCTFEKQPVMIMTIRGGMGATDNTLQVGQTPPVPLEIGSGMSTATHGKQDFIFSLRSPASVTVSRAGSADQTFSGKCISTLQP
jgi:hypothetical protein